jgi:hypothetical protein
LDKAKAYVSLRKPLLLNDLDRQIWLQDRRKVYDHLEASGIDVPRHVYLSRDTYVSTGSGDGNGARDQDVLEFDDHIEVNGVSIHKPFVEKPVDAEGSYFVLGYINPSFSVTLWFYVLTYYPHPDSNFSFLFCFLNFFLKTTTFQSIIQRVSTMFSTFQKIRFR